jgi:hypothetical protein
METVCISEIGICLQHLHRRENVRCDRRITDNSSDSVSIMCADIVRKILYGINNSDWLLCARSRRFIMVFTRVHHWPLSWTSWIHSTPPPPPPPRPSQSSYDPFWSQPRSSEWALSYGVVTKATCNFSLLSHTCHMLRPPHPPWFYLRNIWWWSMNLFTVHCEFSSVRLSVWN